MFLTRLLVWPLGCYLGENPRGTIVCSSYRLVQSVCSAVGHMEYKPFGTISQAS